MPSKNTNPADLHRAAVKDIAAMVLPYSLGTFNDNFFKQAVMLLAINAGLSRLQGWGTILFALPFVLFSAWAGWLADRYSKRGIIIISKFMELAAMLLALAALTTLGWEAMLGVVFIMAAQSTLFSPAMNGSIPELFPSEKVPAVNAIIKLTTTCTILLGLALAGVCLDWKAPAFLSASLANAINAMPGQNLSPFGRALVAGIAIVASIIGLLFSFAIRRRPAACPAASPQARPFPLAGPLVSLRETASLRQTPALSVTLWGEAFFYFISSLAVLCINYFSKSQMGFSDTLTSLPVVTLMVGVCAGSIYSAKHGAEGWKFLTMPTALLIALGLGLSALAALMSAGAGLAWMLLCYVVAGFGGGAFLIPQVSFNQLCPGPEEKGRVLGLSNFMSFSGILLSGLLYYLMDIAKTPPWLMLVFTSLMLVLFVFWQLRRIFRLEPDHLADSCRCLPGAILRGILSLRYKMRVSGLEKISPPEEGRPILFLPNHPAFIDPVIIYSLLAGVKPRPLADSAQVKSPFMQKVQKKLDIIPIPDLRKDGGKGMQGVIMGLNEVIATLKNGRCALLYPSGTMYHSRLENLGNNSGVARILEALPDVRIVLVRTKGLWGSSFSCVATGRNPQLGKAVKQAFITLLCNLFILTPRRELRIDFIEPQDLPRPAPGEKPDRRAINAFMQEFYNHDAPPALAPPRFFWQGRKARALPDPAINGASVNSLPPVTEKNDACNGKNDTCNGKNNE